MSFFTKKDKNNTNRCPKCDGTNVDFKTDWKTKKIIYKCSCGHTW